MISAEETTSLKKKVRCDDIFSNMSEPELVSSAEPVVYQETLGEADNMKSFTDSKKKLQIANKKVVGITCDYLYSVHCRDK